MSDGPLHAADADGPDEAETTLLTAIKDALSNDTISISK